MRDNPATRGAGGRTGADVLVVAALREEYDAARAVAGFSAWHGHGNGGPAPYEMSALDLGAGQSLTVALARPTRMGGRGDRWALTGAGLERIRRIAYHDVDGPARLPFVVTAGPMASGSAVVADPKVWEWLAASQRTVLALEMEAATVATIAHERRVPHWLVAKGVMDHADAGKDDRFKGFAARASAEVLFALLGTLLRPAVTPPRPAVAAPRIPGHVKLEVVRRLAYDWQDLADVVGVPSYEMRRFRTGDEARELWSWLESRTRLADLPDALTEIGRADLAEVLRAYV